MRYCTLCDKYCMHVFREDHEAENTFIFINKNKHCSWMRQSWGQTNFCRAAYADCQLNKIFSHAINQLLYQYYKSLALCNIHGEVASGVDALTDDYRMAKLYCHINQCDASVQYFAILHAHKYCTMSRKPRRLKITYTLTFIRKNKRRSAMRQSLQQKAFVARQNSGAVRQKL